MSQAFCLNVNEVKQRLSDLFDKLSMQWLAGDGKWPVSINLGLPNQKTALNNIAVISRWIAEWRQWQGAGQLQWGSRNWPTLGKQQLPEKIIFSNVLEIIQWLNQSMQWERMCHRYQQLTQRWPTLKRYCAKYHDVLTSYSDEDFIHLQNVLTWMIDNPNSQIYLRELPIPQIDTKWIETRKLTLYRLLKIIKAIDNTQQDFYEVAGLKSEPYLVRMRILDENLRIQLKGLSDIRASIFDLAKLNFSVRRVYIVENLRTGLAFADIPGAVVFMGLGYSVNKLSEIPWVTTAPCYYWGDCDTHGFAILNRARKHLPQLQSILMDQATLLKAKNFWGQEDKPCQIENNDYLTVDEKNVYTNLKNNTWGYQIRLEQERIFWNDAWQTIKNT